MRRSEMARPEPERSKDHLTSKFHSFVVRQSFGLLDLTPIIWSLLSTEQNLSRNRVRKRCFFSSPDKKGV
jgi:hypothetical protein